MKDAIDIADAEIDDNVLRVTPEDQRGMKYRQGGDTYYSAKEPRTTKHLGKIGFLQLKEIHLNIIGEESWTMEKHFIYDVSWDKFTIGVDGVIREAGGEE